MRGVTSTSRGVLALLAVLLFTGVSDGSDPPGQATTAQLPGSQASAAAREAHSNAAAPTCDEGGHAASMLLAGALTVSPEPGALDAAPQTQISLVGVSAGDLSGVTVTGSRSGAHDGRLEPYSQGDGASFHPEQSL